MKRIFLIGAGRSATTLIKYLLELCGQYDWHLRVGDISLPTAQAKIAGHPKAQAVQFNIHNEAQCHQEITGSDLVISMLPARFHKLAAKICVAYKKPFLTASYVSEDIRALNWDAQKSGVILLMECGLDPGIDHMSGMKILDQIKAAGHQLQGFETFTGGLVAPESTLENPWQYKFTWNPRNVVLAGQGIVKFIQQGRYKYIPYHRLFRRTEQIHIPGHGYFEGYANRDSLKYLDVYQLHGIQTLYRGTLRRPGFSRAWNVFVQLGATDDSYEMTGVNSMTHRDFINSFLVYDPKNSVELKLAHYMNLEIEGEIMFKLKWLGIFDREPIGLDKGTPAQILEHILHKKWDLKGGDRDMIVMWHKFDFLDNEKARQIQSYMVIKGKTDGNTAMAQTVGLPLGIAAKLILTGEIQATGVQIPVVSGIYEPILRDLKQFGIRFEEKEILMQGKPDP